MPISLLVKSGAVKEAGLGSAVEEGGKVRREAADSFKVVVKS